MTTELTWTGSPEDMTARSGEYVLKVKSKGKWNKVWRVYFNGTQIKMDYAIKEDTAKAAAINAMKEHLKKK